MTAISPSYPYTLQNGTTADATQVMANFLQIQNDVNTYAAPLASPVLTGTPSAPTAIAGTATTQLATTAFVTASPQFTGTPIAPTAAPGTNTTQIATTAFVAAAGFAPTASPTFTGTPIAPTAAPGTNTTQIATTAFVATSFAPLASPTFTGTPAAPTAALGTNTTQLATTAYALAAIANILPKASAGVGQLVTIGGTVSTDVVLPAGGTWAYFAIRFSNSGTYDSGQAAGVAAGGTTVLTVAATKNSYGFAWRIA